MAISIEEAERRLNSGGDISAITAAQWRQLEQIEARNNAAAAAAAAAPNPLDASAQQAPSVTYNGLNPGDGSAVYTPGDYAPNPGFIDWANSIGAANTPGGGSTTPAEDSAAAREKERLKQQGNTIAAYFRSIGLGALADWAIKSSADGYTEEYIYLEMRNQPAYKQRFPAMQSFINDRIPFTEAEYMEYEQAAQALDQRYGLPDNMIYNSVTDLLTNRVDAEELSDRAAMAGAAAIQAPEDFKTTMRNYYGIDEGGLAAYFLDPDNVLDSLKKQSAASLSGTIAGRQGIANLPKDLAEDLYDRGVREESQMVEGFSQANQLRGLSSGKANTASQEQLIRGAFGDSAAQEAVAKVQRIRRASNRGGGGYVGGESGASGLGSASY